MKKYNVRPVAADDVSCVVAYFHDLSTEDCDRMGVAKENLPPRDKMQAAMIAQIKNPPEVCKGFMLIWELDGKPIGMNTIKDMEIGGVGYMHLHMWEHIERGKGHGGQFFCRAALDFYERFNLKKILCEPKTTNAMPNRMLAKVGFAIERTYTGSSSAISRECELNSYFIDPKICAAYLHR